MMILQELLFPNFDTCATYEMFFKPHPKVYYDPEARAVHVPQWEHLFFDTYFNCFSVAKWNKYTRLDNLKLQLELQGAFHVRLMHQFIIHEEPFTNIFCERVCRCEARSVFEFELPVSEFDRGIISFQLDALEPADNLYFGGRYVTEIDEGTLNRADIAIDITTFRREKFVQRNIALLNREIINCPESPMYGHLDVFISDNGQTLDIPALESDRVHIFPNKNVGGSGGFARGMMEILDFQERERPFTHVLVMDDDVLINTDALVRNYRLLQLLKPEYSGKTIAGAMLRLDNRYVQHECGAWWDGSTVHPGKTNLDLRVTMNLLISQNEDAPDYNAWWYGCIPMTKISNENLPLPIFIRFDDVEFGLRTGSDILSMAGICLWHEPFEYKYSGTMEYYHMRNAMIVDALHRPNYSARDAIRFMKSMVKGNLQRFRYNNCEMIFQGVEDFCKGVDFIMNTDGEALHKQVLAAADKFKPLSGLDVKYDDGVYLRTLKKERIRWRLVRLITFNKHLLPRRGTNVVDAAISGVKDFAGKRKVLNYNVMNNTGFVSEYDRSRVIAIYMKQRRMARLLKAKHAEVCEQYRGARHMLTSREFWNRYLQL